MSDIKLYRFDDGTVTELEGRFVTLEKSLQRLIESHLEDLLGIRFLATEHPTGKKHGGRIDTLGIDENGCPVIIEYKRSSNENVINQGLFYLDWLMDHQGEFELLVMNKLSKDVSDQIEWSGPRLLCIAGDFSKYDEHAVEQMNRNIELIRYRSYPENLLILELVNSVQTSTDEKPRVRTRTKDDAPSESKYSLNVKTVSAQLDDAPESLKDLYGAVRDMLLSMGDDVQLKMLKLYVAFRRIRNFACVEVRNREEYVQIWLRINPSTITLEEGFTRDMSATGHYGTGDLEVRIRGMKDLEKARPLLERSYENS